MKFQNGRIDRYNYRQISYIFTRSLTVNKCNLNTNISSQKSNNIILEKQVPNIFKDSGMSVKLSAILEGIQVYMILLVFTGNE